MLLFMDGFDHYASADLLKKWSALASTSPSIVSGAGRRGGGCLRAGSTNQYAIRSLPSGDGWVIGFAVSLPAFPSVASTICALADSGTLQCELKLTTGGNLSVTRNGTAVTGGVSTNTVPVGGYIYIEWKVTIANSIAADSCVVKVNGAEWINVTAGQDLQNTANASANQIRLGTTGSFGGSVDFDDFRVCDDQSGSMNNDFLGDCRVDTVWPDEDGYYQQGTPTPSGTHYTCVDEATPNTTDYVDLAAAGDRDIYDFGDLQHLASQIVFGVQVNPCVSKDDAGARSVGVTARSGSTDADKGDHGLSTTPAYYPEIFETDPATGVAWIESGVNAAQFGPKCTA